MCTLSSRSQCLQRSVYKARALMNSDSLLGKVRLIWEPRSNFSHVLSKLFYLQAEQTITTQYGRRGDAAVSSFLMGRVWWCIRAEGMDTEEGTSSGALEQT